MKTTPDFTRMPNLKYLDLSKCTSLEEVHDSMRCSRSLIELNLRMCESLERFPYVNVESLEYLDLCLCSSLEKFPEFFGRMKPELKIEMSFSGIREISSSIIHLQAHLTVLDLSSLPNLVSLPSSICELKDLVNLNVSGCSELEILPERIGDLEKLEQLHASLTLISRPPSSISRLNKLKSLDFASYISEDRVYFVFPQVNEGLVSLEKLDLRGCNLIDGGLPEDIGNLSSLKELNLCENNFEHLPQSISQLGALRTLLLSNCNRLAQLPEFPQQLNRIEAEWSNGSLCNSLFQNISSLQHDISALDSLSLRMFKSWSIKRYIPSWFHHRAMDTSVLLVNLPENWYVSDNFLGFAVCYCGLFVDDITTYLIPLCDDGTSWMAQKFSLSEHSTIDINFLLVPLAGLWDASKANGKTPNDYGYLKLSFSEAVKFGVRLLYKNEAELQIGMRRSRDEEGSCLSSKKQRSQVQVSLLQLFPKRPGL